MKANLHLHSRYSDGVQWPEEVAGRAAHVGLELVSLTDHDSMEGVGEFMNACRAFGLTCLAGSEVDCVAPEIDFNSEILAYFPHGKFGQTQELLKNLVRERERKIISYIEKANKLFNRKDLLFDDVREQKIGFTPLKKQDYHFSYIKVDLYQYFIKKGAIPEKLGYRDFKKEFGPTLFPAELDTKPDMARTVKTILSDGGFPVLAHPGILFDFSAEKMRNEISRLRKILAFCKDAGIWGVEKYYYRDNRDELNAIVIEEADKLHFRYTYGTDCHGRNSQYDTIEKSFGEFDLAEFDR